MNRCKLILVAIFLMLGLVAGIILQNSLFAAFCVVSAALAILIPFVLVIGAIAVFQMIIHNHRFKKTIRYLLLIGCSSILSLVVLLATGGSINRWKIKAVESYVSHAVLILDQIKAKTGVYPPELPINVIGEPPSLLRYYGSYYATPESFCFEYIDEPAGWAGGEGFLKFESSRREWTDDR